MRHTINGHLQQKSGDYINFKYINRRIFKGNEKLHPQDFNDLLVATDNKLL